MFAIKCIDMVSPPEPVDLASVVIQSVYDYRHGYFGHANLSISWYNPPGVCPLVYAMYIAGHCLFDIRHISHQLLQA